MNDEILASEILKWQVAKVKLDHYKKLEMELRKSIVNDVTDGKLGAKFNDYVKGIQVKASQPTETSIEDKDELMNDYEALPPEIQECFPLKPSFSKTAYKKLSAEDKKLANIYIVEKPTTPKLSIVMPCTK